MIESTNKENTSEDLTNYIANLMLLNVGGRFNSISNNGEFIEVYDIYIKKLIKFKVSIQND